MSLAHRIFEAIGHPLWGAILYGIVFWLLVSPGQGVDYLSYPNGNDWGAFLILLGLPVFALINIRFFRRPTPVVDAISGRVLSWTRVGFGLLCIMVLAYWHQRYAAQIIDSPISIKQADMLPLMLEGFKDLDALRSPYRPHEFEWVLKNYYLPTTFLPYYGVYKLGLDIRWVTIVCLDGIGVGLLYVLRGRMNGWSGRLLALIAWAAVYSVFAKFVLDRSLVRLIHLGPYWLYTCMLLVAVVRRNYFWVVFWATLALLSREPALFLVSSLVVAYGKIHPRAVLKAVAVVFVVGVLSYLPFIIDNPLFYRGNIEQYSSLGRYLGWYQERFIGFSALLGQLGIAGLRWPLLLVLQAGVLWGTWYWMRRDNVLLIVASAFCSVTLFYLFALITWEYAFVPSVAVLSVWLIFAVGECFGEPRRERH